MCVRTHIFLRFICLNVQICLPLQRTTMIPIIKLGELVNK